MKVLFLPSSYIPDTLGGTEIYVHRLAEDLARRGVKSIVAHHSVTQRKFDGQANYKVAVLPTLRKPRRTELYRNTMNEDPPGFRALLESERPDLLHFHSYSLGAGVDHARVAREYGIPYVVTYHIPGMSCPRGTLFRWGVKRCDGKVEKKRCAACILQRQGLPRALASLLSQSSQSAWGLPDSRFILPIAMPDLIEAWRASWEDFMANSSKIIACADWCREVLVLNGISEAKVVTIRQAIEGKDVRRKLRLPLPQNQVLRIGFIGRFTAVKAPDSVALTAQGLKGLGVETECELVGPIAAQERRWANRLIKRCQPMARYLGVKRGEELRSWLRSLHLLVIPGQGMETGPLTLLEAWEEGVPVVGVNTGGVREFMVGAGFRSLLFEPNDLIGMIESVLRARQWTAANGSGDVEIPGQESLTERMISIYSEAISSSKVSRVSSARTARI